MKAPILHSVLEDIECQQQKFRKERTLRSSLEFESVVESAVLFGVGISAMAVSIFSLSAFMFAGSPSGGRQCGRPALLLSV